MSDIREITVTVVHCGKVDCDLFFKEFDEEWRDYLGDEGEPTQDDRDQFIADTVAEIGLDALDDFATQYDSETTTDVRPRWRREDVSDDEGETS